MDRERVGVCVCGLHSAWIGEMSACQSDELKNQITLTWTKSTTPQKYIKQIFIRIMIEMEF